MIFYSSPRLLSSEQYFSPDLETQCIYLFPVDFAVAGHCPYLQVNFRSINSEMRFLNAIFLQLK